MDVDAILEWLSNHTTELVLLAGGIIAVLVVFFYLKNKDSTMYKFAMLFGVIAGVAMIYVAVSGWNELNLATTIIVLVGGFALVIRPFREIHFAALLALLVMAITYVMLGTLDGATVLEIDVSFLAHGWPRIIISAVVGAIVYMITNFTEELIKIFGMILNFWPLLFMLGLVCIAEGASIYMGYGSLYDLYVNYYAGTEGIILSM